MHATRLPHLVNGVLLLLLLTGSLWVYPTLPEQIPKHVGPRWVAYWETTLLRWLSLPLMTGVCMALIYVPAWRMGPVRSLQAFSVPNRTQYRHLPPRHKRNIADLLERGTYWMATPMPVFFGVSQARTYYAVTTFGPPLPTFETGTMAAFLLVMLGIAGGLRWWVSRRIRRVSDREDE